MWDVFTRTFDPLEWIWVACSVIALVASIANLRNALADRRWVVDSELNGLLEIETKGAVIEEWMRVGKSILLLAAGILVLLIPNPPPVFRFDLVTTFRIILIALNLLITASAVWVRQKRIEMGRYRGGTYYNDNNHPHRRRGDRPPTESPQEKEDEQQ